MPLVRRLTPQEATLHIHQLAAVLRDCVAGGASVSFLEPFTESEALSFYSSCIDEIARDRRILLAAFDGEEVAGSLQVITAMPPNQPHRAELAKMLVRRSSRGLGLAKALLAAAEDEARAAGKTLLTLDTVVGEAADYLYARSGWTRAGEIPDYALYPDGRLCATAIYWKKI